MGIPLEPRSSDKIYAGLDAAQDLVLDFIDLVAARGQFDLLAGAKVSFDFDAVLVSEGWKGTALCGLSKTPCSCTGYPEPAPKGILRHTTDYHLYPSQCGCLSG